MKTTKKTADKKPVKRKSPKKTASSSGVSSVPVSLEKDSAASSANPDFSNPIYQRSNQLLVIALMLAWLFDFLFWKNSIGVNFPIFLVACLVGGGYWLLANDIRPARNSLWLLIPFLFFAVFSFLRQEPLTVFLMFVFAIVTFGLFASTYIGGKWIRYGLGNYLQKTLLLIGDMISASLIYFPKARRVQDELGADKGGIPIWGLLRGLLFALPILICFGSLLAAGDLVFKERLGDFLDLDNFSENVFRGILILFYAYVLAGVLIHAALKSKDEHLAGEVKSFVKPFLGFAESAVILGSVSILFLGFVIVQFQYFFGGETNIGVEGYTYSQYARRGFNELVTVAFFSLVLIFGLSSITRRESEGQRRAYSMLNVILAIFVLIILVSAYQRISLAIDWHGFSRLRLYPRIFLIWLGLLFVTVVFLEFVRKESYFAFAAVLASTGFVVSLALVNIDAAIIKRNVPRVLQGKNLNVAHLASLSSDAVPALADEFYSSSYPDWAHEGIGAALTCYLHFDNYEESYSDWRSFNLSRWRAHVALQNIEKHLQDYSVNDQKPWNVRVKTPGGEWYECRYYSNAEER